MPACPVLRLPDATLKRRTEPVSAVGEAERTLAANLVDTMRVSPGCVGLAAPQIGVSIRAFCVDVTGHKKAVSCHGLVVMFNPELIVAEKPASAREGCMSVPDLTGDVSRPTHVVMRGLGLDGQEQVLRADAFEARALLHELDHLDGLLFLDRVSSPGGVFPRRVYRS